MADDNDLFVNINLDDVDDGLEPMPDGQAICRVHTITQKKKEGGEYPYLEIVLKPHDNPQFANRQLWLNLSFHPKALWNMKLFATALGIYQKGSSGINWSSARERLVSVNIKTEPARNDPERKVNTVNTPYHAVR